ncbi:hypothetical protein [Streptomyces sp. NPDC096351]|uniref:hypothetical protein n=1 Tax=Streptomyces sp. NPDC096351 TaxID=3366087 RepID=UPI00382C5250
MTTTDPLKHLRGYGRRNPETGMLHGHIYYPDGHPPVPSGCRWCGLSGTHWQFWRPGKGYHQYEPPTQAQILARMRARRKARLAGPALLHATTAWAPDPDGESADSYCKDCGNSACARWWRIENRLHLRRQGLRRWPRNDVPF